MTSSPSATSRSSPSSSGAFGRVGQQLRDLRVAAPLFLLAILGMVILPLPPVLLDVLFTFNIVLSLVVILVSVNSRRPLDFSIFPSVILATTLMRLSLNVASTRVVLLHGHEGTHAAGKVIEAFGNVVIGGNFIVGLVVFVILMVVNFIVVTKGAERISDVSARFTRSPGKEEDAFRLGADHVVLSSDPAQMASVAGRFDVIIDTVPYDHDVNPYMPTLTLEGVLVLVGYMGPLGTAVNAGGVVRGRRAITGSFIGGLAETQQMLDFCGQHGIVSDVEIISINQINQAYERMLKSDVKYRFVIDMASLKS